MYRTAHMKVSHSAYQKQGQELQAARTQAAEYSQLTKMQQENKWVAAADMRNADLSIGGENESVDRVGCGADNWVHNRKHQEGQCRG